MTEENPHDKREDGDLDHEPGERRNFRRDHELQGHSHCATVLGASAHLLLQLWGPDGWEAARRCLKTVHVCSCAMSCSKGAR